MARRKKIKTQGKLQLSRYFQEFAPGDSVSVVKEQAVQSSFPLRIQGRTGTVESRRGKAYMIKIEDGSKEKKFLIEPVHLKKIRIIKSSAV
ncbi:50S ribosomal protein L21e [Candidatus Pacearchaeota archaeon]|nr:50S ribosomal protein L21e [Candidatus Pacearchaeota archaeon]